MNTRLCFRITGLSLVLAMFIAVPGAFGEVLYTTTDLGKGYAMDVSPSGMVAFGYPAGRWKPIGGMDGLGGSAYSYAQGVNTAGQVAGKSSVSGYYHAHYWSETNAMTDLGTLEIGRSSWGNAINDFGQVVGTSKTYYNDADTERAFLWTLGSGNPMQDLGTLGGSKSGASDINATGHVVGGSTTATSAYEHAFLYIDSSTPMQDLGDKGTGYSWAYGINDLGQVVGNYGLYHRAFIWTDAGGMEDLGTLGGQSWAYEINESGQIVGAAYPTDSSAYKRAILWDSAGDSPVDLNTLIDPALGWDLRAAQAINDKGQIVGYGKIGGETHGYLLTLIPEPATLSLLGLGGLALIRRRRK